jgi:hypothetical protein
MEQIIERVTCVEWAGEKYSLHLDLEQANNFINAWKSCGMNMNVKDIYEVLTNESGLHRIKRGNHGEFVERNDFVEWR